MTSGMVRPISPPVRSANTTMKFCSISTATRVVQPKIGPAHAQRRQTPAQIRRSPTPSRPARCTDYTDQPYWLFEGYPRYRRRRRSGRSGPKFTSPANPNSRVPRHREHAEVIGDREQAENIAGDIKRQRRGDDHHAERNPETARDLKKLAMLIASRAGPAAGYTSR